MRYIFFAILRSTSACLPRSRFACCFRFRWSYTSTLYAFSHSLSVFHTRTVACWTVGEANGGRKQSAVLVHHWPGLLCSPPFPLSVSSNAMDATCEHLPMSWMLEGPRCTWWDDNNNPYPFELVLKSCRLKDDWRWRVSRLTEIEIDQLTLCSEWLYTQG